MFNTLIAALLLVPLVVFGTDAAAVHGTAAFELEGNAVQDTNDDWANVCYEANGGNAAAAALCGTSQATTGGGGATAVSWENDGALNATIFSGGGSKDPQDISAWAWKDESGGLPDKDNLLHSFAARYSLDPATACPAGSSPTCEVLYFGSDRYDNSGDAQQGVWFLQDEVALGTHKVGGAKGFNGNHVPGDVLIISEFSNGGTTSTIKVLEWDPTCTKTEGSCESENLRKLSEAVNAKCTGTLPPNDPYCGIVNPTDGTDAPWPFLDKKGNDTYLQGELFEAGLNLSVLGLADRCFSTVVSETRSSTSATATLKDFVIDTFGQCGTELTTTPVDNGGTTIPDSGISIGTSGAVQVRDSAVLEVTGASTWSGTLQFHLCGPTAVDSTALCSSGGVPIGTAFGVDNFTSQPILSDAATVTAAGQYCWRGDFTSSTVGLEDASDSSAGECFVVNPVTPALSTQAVDAAGNAVASVPLGTAIYDKATLSGTANQPGTDGPSGSSINATNGAPAGGSVNFKLYGPGIANCNILASGFLTDGITVSVNGDGTYGGPTTVGFTPTAPGDYYWKAVYSGNSPNTLGVTHNGDCADPNEKVTVQQLNPGISTAQSFVPNDAATITVASGGGDLAGTVVFKLYVNDASCAGTPAYTSAAIDISTGTGGGVSRTVVSNNTTSYATSGTTFHWVVHYTSTNPAHTNVTSGCGVEHSSITIENTGTPS